VITITGIRDHLQPEWLITITGIRIIAMLALAALTLSVVSGLLIISRVAIMLTEKKDRLEEFSTVLHFNILSCGCGFLLVALLVAHKVFSWEPDLQSLGRALGSL